MANNLPSNLKRHTMFRDKPYSHKVNFPEGYTMPTLITAEVRKNNRVIIGIAPSIVKTGQSFTFTYPPETLSKIQGLYDHYFLFDGKQFLGGEINTVIQIGDPTGGETNVTIAGDQITVIEIPGSQLAFETLEEVTALAGQVDADAQAVETGRAATEGYRDEVIEMKEETETARDEVVALAAANVTVQNYSDAVPLFTGSIFRRIDVKTDAVYNLDDDPASPTYNQGLPSFYTYNPALPSGKRVAFLGLDPDYLTNS